MKGHTTHYVGDDCPGGHAEPALRNPTPVCACGHTITWHRLVNDARLGCFGHSVGHPPCPCPEWRPQP